MINPVQKTGRMGPGMAYQNNAPTNKQVKRPLQWTEALVTLYINILPLTQSYICSLKPDSKKQVLNWKTGEKLWCQTQAANLKDKVLQLNNSESVKSSIPRLYLQ